MLRLLRQGILDWRYLMIKFTLEFVVLMVIVTISLIIALSIMFRSILPVLLIAGLVLYVYKHKHKPVESSKCPECEVREKIDNA
jgi:hypothetical protein